MAALFVLYEYVYRKHMKMATSDIKIYSYVHDVAPNVSGPRLNIKTVLSTYGDFHVKDKTAVRTSYL